MDRPSRSWSFYSGKALGVALLTSVLGVSGLYANGMPPGTSSQAPAYLEEECGQGCQNGVDAARRGTARFMDEEVALDAGFVPDPVCVALPGVGGMGIHYTNASRMADIDVDPRWPEILLYADRPDGRRQLVAVEYHAPVLSNGQPWFAATPPPTIDNPAPVLFGHTFDGPMPGHNPAMPWHYDLHVWVWKHNPSGMFSQFNPRVACS